MNNLPWSEILKILTPNLKTVKGFSKALAKVVVKFILKLSGPQGYVTSLILAHAIKWGLIEIQDIVQELKDKKAVKDLDESLKSGDVEKIKQDGKKVLEG